MSCPVTLAGNEQLYDFQSIAPWIKTYGTNPLTGNKKPNLQYYTLDDLEFQPWAAQNICNYIQNSPTKKNKDYTTNLINTSQINPLIQHQNIDNLLKVISCKKNKQTKGNSRSWLSYLLMQNTFNESDNAPENTVFEKFKKAFKYQFFFYRFKSYHEKCTLWGLRSIRSGLTIIAISLIAHFIFEAFTLEVLYCLLFLSLFPLITGVLIYAYPSCIDRIGLLDNIIESPFESYITQETNSTALSLYESQTEHHTKAYEEHQDVDMYRYSEEKTSNTMRKKITDAAQEHLFKAKMLLADFIRHTSPMKHLRHTNSLTKETNTTPLIPSKFYRSNTLTTPITAIMLIFDRIAGFFMPSISNSCPEYTPQLAATLKKLHIVEPKSPPLSPHQTPPSTPTRSSSLEVNL
ncbi:MAG TPA: hypothetical protein QF353_06830 [Gammaproteobacteria bacterium]|nr:hypothetical protein [Gammaproteobacteria bacterium]